MSIDHDTRLGEFVHSMCDAMLAHGKDTLRMTVTVAGVRAVYEIRLVSARRLVKRRGGRPKMRRIGGVLAIESRNATR